MQDDLFQTATSSQQDTHASHLVRPGSDEARKMTVTSGRKYLPLCKQSGRVGAFSRMFLDTSTWASTKCFLTWKVKATPSNHLLFQLAPSMPRTDAIESGSLLHTPTAKANQMSPEMVKKGSGCGVPRQMMPTPTASDHIERNSTSSEAVNPLTGKSVSLDRFVKFWPDEETQQSGQPRMWATPRTTDATGGPRKLDERGRRISQNNPNLVFGANLADQIRMWPTPIATDGSKCPTGSLAKLVEAGNKYMNKNGTPIAHKKHMFSTPTASDAKGAPANRYLGSEKSHGNLSEQVRTSPTSGQLNPQWVEWLMGYPEGWTDLKG